MLKRILKDFSLNFHNFWFYLIPHTRFRKVKPLELSIYMTLTLHFLLIPHYLLPATNFIGEWLIYKTFWTDKPNIKQKIEIL